MRSWLTAPPQLFWQICLAALLAGAWAAEYPGYGAAGLLLTSTAAWPFLRLGKNPATLTARLAALALAFALGLALTAQALNRPTPDTPEYVLDRAGHQITATIKEISGLPPRAPLVPGSLPGEPSAPDPLVPAPVEAAHLVATTAQNAGLSAPGPQTPPPQQSETALHKEHPRPEAYRLRLADVTVFPENTDLAPVKLPGDLLWTWQLTGDGSPGGANKANFSTASTPPPSPPLPGQTVSVHLRIREMRGFSNPGVADSADRHVREGVLFRAYSNAAEDGAAFNGPADFGQQARRVLHERFLAALDNPGDPDDPGRAALPALIFDDRAWLTDAQNDLFARASLSHSLALSGMHLGFMAALGWMLARLLCRLRPGLMLRLPKGKWAVLCAAPLVAAYLWVGGASPSLLRAALMFACWGAFVLMDRPHPLLDGLAVAVLILFLADPVVIFDLRLQLSVLCMLAIGLTLPAINALARWLIPPLELAPPSSGDAGGHGASLQVQRGLPARLCSRLQIPLRGHLRGLARGALTLLCVSAAIQLALAPVQADAFNQATPWFILNLLWLPVLSAWVFPWAILGLLLCAVPGLTLPAAWALDLAALPTTWLFKLLAAMDAAHILTAPLVVRPHGVTMLGYAALLMALCAALRQADRRRLFPEGPRRRPAAHPVTHIEALLLAGFLCLGFGVWERYDQEHPAGLRVRVLDVGQGLSLLLEGTDGQRILVDGGGSPLSAFNVGEYVLIPLLTANRPPRLDAIINTHPDSDHLRGLLPVLRRLEVSAVWLTRPPRAPLEKMLLDQALTEAGLKPGRLSAGQRLPLDSLHYLETLYPMATARGGRNQLSLAAMVVYAPEERGLFLLTGDLTKSGTRRIMKEAKARAANGAAGGQMGGAVGGTVDGLADVPATGQMPSPASPLRCDVVQAPHHGSKNSLVKGFYQAAAPKAVVAGTGYRNQWGFPSPELRETLRAMGIPLLDTAADGQIILRWDGHGLFLGPERARH